MKFVLAASDEEYSQLYEARKGGTIRRKESEAQECRWNREPQMKPGRSRQPPVSSSVDHQGRGDRNSQSKEGSSRRSRRKHGKQSLHNRRVSSAILVGNPGRRVKQPFFSRLPTRLR
jgi:hypothetical protein